MSKRRCDKCQRLLAGKKGHGFPMFGGRAIWCGACTYPKGSR